MKVTDGPILYHGTDEAIIKSLCAGASDRRFIALVVSSSVVLKPDGCTSRNIHFYSVGVPSGGTEPRVESLFQALVNRSTELPTASSLDELEVEKLWNEVDPRSDLMLKLRTLERAIYAGPDDHGQVIPEHQAALVRFYDAGSIPSYVEKHRDYLKGCEKNRKLKKNCPSGT